jgi:hypothetical protein
MTNYQKLENFLALPYRQSKVKKNSNLYNALMSLLKTGRCRAGWKTNRGEQRTLQYTINRILMDLRIDSRCSNDSPRHGCACDIIEITSPAFLRELKQRKDE